MSNIEDRKKEEEKKVIKYLEDEIVKESHLEFTLREISEAIDVSYKKTSDALNKLVNVDKKLSVKYRGQNNIAYYTFSPLFGVCRDWVLKNKEK